MGRNSNKVAGEGRRRQQLAGREKWEETASRRQGKMGGDSNKEAGEDGKRQPPGSRG